MRTPNDLGKAGRALQRWLTAEFDCSGAAPLVSELCKLADRLAEVRGILRRDGTMTKGRRHPCADLEIKLSTQFTRVWKTLGLSDADEEQRRLPGRPPEPDRQTRKGR